MDAEFLKACRVWYGEYCAESKRWSNFRERIWNYFQISDAMVQTPAGFGIAINTPFPILAPNPRRRGFSLFVDGAATDIALIKLGNSQPAAGVNDFSRRVTGGSGMGSGPSGQEFPPFPGAVWGQWRVNGSTAAQIFVTEFI